MSVDAVIILAAGSSSRLGRPKQLIPWQGSTLLAHAARTALAAELGPVIIMLGAHADGCRDALSGIDVDIAECAQWAEGMGRTIGAAIAHVALNHPGAEAALITSTDQPFVTAKTLAAIAAARRSHGRRMAAATYSGTIGIPAAFSRSMWDELRQLNGDHGAGSILRAWKAEIIAVPCPEAARDVDTKADVRTLSDTL
jgi:molybdenum cofactor cytidylyltransferase